MGNQQVQEQEGPRHIRGLNTFVEVPPPLVHVISTNEVTAASLVLTTSWGKTYHAVGHAKRHPKDRHDEKLAQVLALSRALHTMSEELREIATSMIQDNEEDAKLAKRLSEKLQRALADSKRDWRA